MEANCFKNTNVINTLPILYAQLRTQVVRFIEWTKTEGTLEVRTHESNGHKWITSSEMAENNNLSLIYFYNSVFLR